MGEARLARAFPVLVAYYRWLRSYRTWQDGSYWATGWASGMDNQPRVPEGCSPGLSPARLTWHVRLLEGHGVARYRFAADGLLDLACARRASPAERPQITAASSIPLQLDMRWQGGSERLHLGPHPPS